MASERTIAPSSLVYIEGVLSALGSTLLEDGDPQAILSAFITVRNALFDRVNEILLAKSSSVGATEKIVLDKATDQPSQPCNVPPANSCKLLRGLPVAGHAAEIVRWCRRRVLQPTARSFTLPATAGEGPRRAARIGPARTLAVLRNAVRRQREAADIGA